MKINFLKNDALNNNIYMKKFIFKVKNGVLNLKIFKKSKQKNTRFGCFLFYCY